MVRGCVAVRLGGGTMHAVGALTAREHSFVSLSRRDILLGRAHSDLTNQSCNSDFNVRTVMWPKEANNFPPVRASS